MRSEALATTDWTQDVRFNCEELDRALLNWLRKRGLSADYMEQRDQRLNKLKEILDDVEEV